MSRSTMALLAGAGLGVAVVGAAALRGQLYLPGPVEDVTVHCGPGARTAKAGEELRVLVWNVQFAGSTKHHFFYDNGRAVHVPPADVAWSLDQITSIVKDFDPDIVLFQEVDRGSDRTGRVDQHRELVSRLGYPCHASAPYHRVPYVPTPSHEMLGRVDLHLSVMSRVRLGAARRHQLPLLDEPWWRRLFNLRRAILDVEVPVSGGPDLTLLDTHLSAFSRGDGTLPRQVAKVLAVTQAAERAGRGVLLAGDFNALPPGVDASNLSVELELYPEDRSPIEPLYASITPAVSLERMREDPDRYYTYAPYGLGRTDRTIDHVFTHGPVKVRDLVVRQDRVDVSDHQPILLRIASLPDGSLR